MSQRNFFAELKRRNVYKVAVAYAVVGWLVIQVTATIVPALHLPEGLTTAVVVLVLVGFPIALVISWAFEMTPQGMKRTDEVSSEEVQKLPYWGKKKFAMFIVGVVVVAAGLLAYQLLRKTEPSLGGVDAKSIAVLPFENLSADKNNAYFADGIQEEILTRLSKIADLKVISRTSTERFKSAPADLKEIAKQLGVANILEGSVQKASNQVRISVQLINALNDSHMWAETYDRNLADVFQVESDLAQKIAGSLEAKLTGREKKEITAPGTNNPEAYDAFLRALTFSNRQGTQDLEELIKYARRAVELDPNYAQAWLLLTVGESQKYFYPETTQSQLARAQAAAETTMRLAPDTADGPSALGIFNYYCLHDWDAALAQLQIAHERAPNDASTLLSIGLVNRRQGQIEQSISVQQDAAKLDPLNEDIWTNIGRGYRGLRRFEEARSMFDRAHAIAPDDPEIVSMRAETYLAQGDLQTAWKIMEPLEFRPTDRGFGGKIALLVFQRRFDDAEGMVLKALSSKDLPPVFVAIGHFGLGEARLAKGDRASAQPFFAQAESELNKLRAAGDNGLFLRSTLMNVEARLGHEDQTRALADSVLEMTRNDAWQLPNTEENVARAYVAVGDFDRAFPLLDHVLRVPGVEVLTTAYLRLDPSWDPIRNDPRFEKLLKARP
ncbi:MAG TPA: tetratricopeptide repeat protein [Chthoniobacterales bacterium]|nr:tetratricopeptide repeat protein [Chthoniobacterales bacterium]